MYASGITYTGASGVSPSSPLAITAANNGTSLSTLTPLTVVLGQDVGQAGNPGKLISNREIPLNGFVLNILTQALSSLGFSPGSIAMLFNPTTSNQQFAELITRQGALPLPSHFGNFQLCWMDQAFTNPDGQIDAVLTSGYNTDGGNGKLNPGEASFATVLESHFQQGGIGNGNFEWYLTTETIAGQVGRHLFLVTDKITGSATLEYSIDNFQMNDTAVNGGAAYATLNDAGMNLIGKTSMTVDIRTQTPALDGGVRIQPQVGSNGKTDFIDLSGVSTGFFQFLSALVWETSNFANGFANFWFQSDAPVANTHGFIFVNSNFGGGGSIFTCWNNGNCSFLSGVTIGVEQPAPAVSSLLDLESTTKGFLPPRMTTVQKNAIVTPATGLMVYDTTLNKLAVFTGATWETVTSI